MISFDLVILSGGKGKKFQKEAKLPKDKALVKLKGKTLLDNLLNRFSNISDSILIVSGSKERRESYKLILDQTNIIQDHKIKIIADDLTERFQPGPLRGILSGIYHSTSKKVVTIPNDIPFLSIESIQRLTEYLELFDICTPIFPDQRLIPLISAYQREKILNYMTIFSWLNRTRADDMIRATRSVCFLPIRKAAVLKEQNIFLNINTSKELEVAEDIFNNIPSDLQIYSIDEKQEIEIFSNSGRKHLNQYLTFCDSQFEIDSKMFQTLKKFAEEFKSQKMFFWEALTCELIAKNQQNEPMKSSEEARKWKGLAVLAYQKETEFWEKQQFPFIVLHCLQDQLKILNHDSPFYRKIYNQIGLLKKTLFNND